MKKLTFKPENATQTLTKLRYLFGGLKQDRLYDIEIKEHREKRSLDANAYFWVLCGQIAAAVGRSNTDIYRGYVKEIGDNFDVLCVQEKAVNKFCEIWQGRGLGWVTETTQSKIGGCVNVIAYYGSSMYDTAQMSRLIDMAVQDCIALEIETKTPDEIDRLVSLWESQE